MAFPRLPLEVMSLSRSHSRLIFTIADRAFAFEFFSRVTELNRTPARMLMFHRDKDKKNTEIARLIIGVNQNASFPARYSGREMLGGKTPEDRLRESAVRKLQACRRVERAT